VDEAGNTRLRDKGTDEWIGENRGEKIKTRKKESKIEK
jgi:hypothetical protein